VPTSDESCGQTRFKLGSRHCAAAFSLQVPKSCTDLDPTLPYISTIGTHKKFVRKNKMLALGVCLPQPCLSAGRRFAASRSRLNYYEQFRFHNNEFVSRTTNSMKCVVNWIPLNTHVRFENTKPCLKASYESSPPCNTTFCPHSCHKHISMRPQAHTHTNASRLDT